MTNEMENNWGAMTGNVPLVDFLNYRNNLHPHSEGTFLRSRSPQS